MSHAGDVERRGRVRRSMAEKRRIVEQTFEVQRDTSQIQMATLRNGGSCLGPDSHQVKDPSELLKSVYSIAPHPGFRREVETLVQKPECFDKERNDHPLLIAIDGKDRKQMECTAAPVACSIQHGRIHSRFHLLRALTRYPHFS